MAPLAGLTDLYGLYGRKENTYLDDSVDRDPSNWGGPAHERVRPSVDPANLGPHDTPVHAAQIDAETTEEAVGTPLPGLPTMPLHSTHGGPYPTFGPHPAEQDHLIASEQMQVLHSPDDGGTAYLRAIPTPEIVHPESGYVDSPNQTILAPVPAQLRSGDQGTDPDQGFGVERQHGFQFGHAFRRWFRDPIPLDRTATHGSDRPFLGRHQIRQNVLTDPTGPYYERGDITTGMMNRDTPTGLPTPYEQPPEPTYRPTTTYEAESGFAGDWMAG